MADYDAPERGLFGSGRSWFGKRTAPPFTLLDLRLQNLFPIRVTLSRTGILPARVGLRKDIVFLDLIRLAGWEGCRVMERESVWMAGTLGHCSFQSATTGHRACDWQQAWLLSGFPP